jgi:hypothetical protein
MRREKREALAAAAAVAAVIILCIIFCRPQPRLEVYQPTVAVYQGADLIAVEDFAASTVVAYNTFRIDVTAPREYAAVPVWGGWSLRGNISTSPLVINLKDVGGPDAYILVFGVASRNETLRQDLGNGFFVYADKYGGYVTFNKTLAAWCLRPPEQYVDVYVWLPSSACSYTDARYIIRVTPSWGIASINTIAVPIYKKTIVKVQGVMPGWHVYTNKTGVYYLSAAP